MALTYVMNTIVLLQVTTSIAFDCKKTIRSFSQGRWSNATYDLCDFVLTGTEPFNWYQIHDSRAIGNYMYYFNIAADITKPTSITSCDSYNATYRQMHQLELGYCINIASYGLPNATCLNPEQNIIPITTLTAAYQTTDDKCWRLHNGVTEPIWKFVNDNDPAAGVQLTYTNGDWCAPFGRNREFTITFLCADDIMLMPDYDQTIYESAGCSYAIEMKTLKGCPIQCPVINDELCSKHGACEYDWHLGSPKCFCYCGWNGADCSIRTNEYCATNVVNNTHSQCMFELTDTSGITAQYDLSPFHLNSDVFRVTDSYNPDFSYLFNICGRIHPLIFTDNFTFPNACYDSSGPCVKQTNINDTNYCLEYENTAGKVPSAVQIDTYNNSTRCYWLGMEVEESYHIPQYKIELLDAEDSGKGVIFTILNGEWCSFVNRNRELRIRLECPDDPRIEFEPSFVRDMQAVVYESSVCIYELSIVSPLACPTECISRMNLEMYAVCSTRGICAADPYANGMSQYPNGSVRCLCDDGYSGLVCQDSSSKITTNVPTIYPSTKTTYSPINSRSSSPTLSTGTIGRTDVARTSTIAIVSTEQTSASSQQSQNDKSQVLIWILVGGMILLIIVVLFCFYKNRKTKQRMNEMNDDFALIQNSNENNQESIMQEQEEQGIEGDQQHVMGEGDDHEQYTHQ